MSSYFDRMAECLNDKNAFIKLILEQYYSYLLDINEKAYVKDERIIVGFLNQFHDIEKSNGSPELKLSALHTLAHQVGSANLKLKSGRYAGNNPWNVPY